MTCLWKNEGRRLGIGGTSRMNLLGNLIFSEITPRSLFDKADIDAFEFAARSHLVRAKRRGWKLWPHYAQQPQQDQPSP